MSIPLLSVSRRIRTTPFTKKLEDHGVKAYTVYNHMLLATTFRTIEEDYHHLKSAVQVWDVSVQRQIEIKGKGAKQLVERLTPRDLTNLTTEKCFYIPIVDQNGGMINDPVLIKLDEDRYWVSIADSDVLFWILGLATSGHLNVKILEASVYPIAIQGPRSKILMKRVFGNAIEDIPFFGIKTLKFNDTDFLISKSGYSKQSGFEIYIEDQDAGLNLWDALFEAGLDLEIRAGCPNLIERVEAGLLSYGNDMTIENSPYECGLGKFCSAKKLKSFTGFNSLIAESLDGPNKQIRYLEIDGVNLPNCIRPWKISRKGKNVGQITSAAYSPDFKTNVAIGMVSKTSWNDNTDVLIHIKEKTYDAVVRSKTFI